MKKLLFFLVLIASLCKTGHAQKEYNNWFFGTNSGIAFTGTSSVFMPGNLVSAEGCSSISDKQGNLLFYTNGVTVWDRSGQPMPNGVGLNGDIESTQTALIANHPANDSIYYIFTVAKEGEANGLQYSVINMKRNGGLGDVDVALGKNVSFGLPYCEKLTAIKHRNRNDIWIIAHRYGTDEFEEFLIDCSGLTTSPQRVFKIGPVINIPSNAPGHLKVSPDGKKIAMASFNSNFDLFDFDDATGVISNHQTIPANPVFTCGPYGVEFSPNSKLLYLTEAYLCNTPVTYEIFQYNIDTTNIAASKIVLDAGTINVAGALQLGPDNKIYVAYNQSPFVGAITNPNARGSAAAFVKQYINLASPALSQAGLPNMITAYDQTLLGKDTTICDGTRKVIKLNLPNTTFLWSDGTTKDSIIITTSGRYTVQITHNGCVYTDTINVIFQPTPKFSLGRDTSLCSDKFPYSLENKIAGASYLWQDSSVNAVFLAKAAGTYWLEASVNGCASRDSINLNSRDVTTFSLGNDTAVCANQPLVLTAGFQAASYLWSTGNRSGAIIAGTTNTYWCEAVNAVGCSYRDSILVTVKPIPNVRLGNDTAICTASFPLKAGQAIPGATYLWKDGSTQADYSIDSAGVYWLQVTQNGCTVSDTINVSANRATAFDLGTDTVVCGSGPLVLNVSPALTSYLWNNGLKTKTLSVSASGVYWCEGINSFGCSFKDTINVLFKSRPVINLGRDTAICQNKLPLTIGQPTALASYKWQDGSTNPVYTVADQGTYWVEVLLDGCSSSDTIKVTANAVPAFSLGADTVACENLPLALAVSQTLSKYLWSTGNTSNKITVASNGEYWAEGTNALGCSFRDSVKVNFKAAPIINLGNDTSLCQDNFPYTIGKAIAGASYLWQDGSTNAVYQVLRQGEYRLKATLNGCNAFDTITVNSVSLPVFSLGADTVSCNINPVKLAINAVANKYLWSNGNITPTISVTRSGEYWGEATNNAGCVFRDTIKVSYTVPPIFSLGKDTVLCQNSSLLLNPGNIGDTYLWQDNSGGPQFLVTRSGSYYVKVSKNGCAGSDSINVTYLSKPAPSLGTDTTICTGQQLLLSANAQGLSYTWQDGSIGNTFNVTQSGRYAVQVANQCGIGSDEIVVNVSPCKIMLPNAFTPGKAANGVFRLTNATGVSEFRLQIFSRWGQQVYQTSKATEGWNGKYNGIDQPAGIYVYILSYKEIDSLKPVNMKGTVMLVR